MMDHVKTRQFTLHLDRSFPALTSWVPSFRAIPSLLRSSINQFSVGLPSRGIRSENFALSELNVLNSKKAVFFKSSPHLKGW